MLFLPLYLIQSKGISEGQTIWIPAFFALRMLLFTNPAGLLGDRVGHLRTMRGLAIVGTTMVLGFVFLESYWAMGISADIFEHYGGAVVLYHLAGLWLGFILCTAIFYRDDPAARRRQVRFTLRRRPSA